MGGWHETSEATRLAILTAMDIDSTSAGRAEATPVYVMWPGQTMPLDRPADLRLEDGTALQVHSPPARLPSWLSRSLHSLAGRWVT